VRTTSICSVSSGATHTDGDFVYHDVRGDARRRENNARDALSGLARGRVRLGADTTLTLLLVGLDDTRGEPGVEQFERPEAESSRGRLLLAAAADDPSLFDGRVVGGLSVHAARQTDTYRDPAPTLWGAPRFAGLEDDAFGVRAHATWATFATHLPRLAVEARREVARTRVDGAETRENRRLGLAAVLSDEMALLGERFVVGAALRVDDTDARSPLLVPQGGLTVQPLDALPGLRLRANVGRVFRDPSVDELYWRAPGLRGNPSLDPEDGVAWDAGLEVALRDDAHVTAVAFGQRYEHLILWMPVQAHLVEAQGHHGATVAGQELTVAAHGGPLGLNAAYTHLDARFDAAPRTPLPHRPAHRLSARVDAAVGQARVFVGHERRSEVRADRFGYRRVPGHGLWDAGLAGPIGRGFEVDLTFRNLTHELSARDAVQQPLPGRTWLFTLRYLPVAAGEEP
jgi:outer membrane receptor protein involved in Fe transport